jgi:hypothetical protein
MASKLKTEVQIDSLEFGPTGIQLDLTPEQSVKLLRAVLTGEAIRINLRTPREGQHRDTPELYAAS